MAKKIIAIIGTPLYPLTVGQSAIIREAAGIRQTSPVEHIVKNPSGMVEVITRNTVYHLTVADPMDTTVLGFHTLG